MSEHEQEDHERGSEVQYGQQNGQQHDNTMDTLLESRIANVLHEQASRLHFTSATHRQVMKRIAQRSKQRRVLSPAFAFASIAVLVVVVLVVLIQLLYHQPVAVTPVHYGLTTTLETPAALAQGGHLASLDPTGQHLVYQSAQGIGVMYTANIQNPDATNVLAMRDALDASWSPDGSSLVATIEPGGASQPFLALIRTGTYMTPLGHNALAASWSPINPDQIVYITQAKGITQVFATTPQKNSPAHLLATLPVATTIQHLVWSPDGQTLALVTTANSTASRALYLLNMHTYSVKELLAPGDFTIGTVAWSPSSHYLSYTRTDIQGNTTIQTVNAATQQIAFSIKLRGTLDGLSWSPSSNAILYSDSGKLVAYVLHGTAVTFTQNTSKQISPFWLSDGRILCLSVVQGTATLSILAAQKSR